jgi:hypothetical protein
MSAKSPCHSSSQEMVLQSSRALLRTSRLFAANFARYKPRNKYRMAFPERRHLMSDMHVAYLEGSSSFVSLSAMTRSQGLIDSICPDRTGMFVSTSWAAGPSYFTSVGEEE